MRKVTPLLLFLLCANVVVGQFGNEYDVSKSTANPFVFPCDLDGDGDIDVISSSRNKTAWYENLGGGNFSSQKIINSFWGQPYAADINNDGYIDILLRTDYEILWFENIGNAYSFSQANIIRDGSSMNQLRSIDTADVDNDGDIDIFFANFTGNSISWYENLGNGGFGVEQVISTNTLGVTSVKASDLNSDGSIDVISASKVDGKIAWYENLGGGIFSSQKLIAVSADIEHVTSADFDLDGDIDIAWASTGNFKRITYAENLGNAIFSNTVLSTSAMLPTALGSGDIDSDGDLDLLVGGTLRVASHENLGNVFSSSLNIIDINNTLGNRSIFGVDIDNDGDDDILTASINDDKVGWYENIGFGNFSSFIAISSNLNDIKEIFVADMDGDGDNDIIAASFGRISLFRNIQYGVMEDQIVISDSSFGATSIHAEDMDNDGDLDILAALVGSIYGKIVWFENYGSNSFSNQKVILDSLLGVRDTYPADMDGDGDNDIIVLNQFSMGGNYFISWVENLGGGIFNSIQNFIIYNDSDKLSAIDSDGDGILNAAASEIDISTVDLDNDSDIDLLRIRDFSNSDMINYYRNDGINNFNLVYTKSFNRIYSLYANDIDGDGLNDIIMGLDTTVQNINYNVIKWFKNLGNNTFENKTHINKLSPFASISIFAKDMDGDGDNDVIQASYLEEKISWVENFYFSPYQLKGNLYYDANQNKIKDTNEIGLSFIQMQLQPTGQSCYTSTTGEYIFAPDTGAYVVNYIPNTLWNLTTDSVSYNRTLTGASPLVDSLDFGFFPDTIFTSIQTDFTGGFPRCNDTINYWIDIHNQGTTLPSGVIHVQLDDSVDFVSAAFTPDSIVGQNIYWSYDSLFFYSHLNINLQVTMPPFTSMGDTLTSYLTVYELDGFGNVIYTNTDSLNQVSVCAYDPNDKSVLPKGIGVEGFILNDEPFLEYLIRFQNTGNDTAITVMVRDQLDSNLDWNSMQIISHSHNMQAWIEQDGEAVFKFENIMLPDSGADFIASQGYVKFRINLKPNIISGTQIFNKSDIYFDNNPAVITNIVVNTVYDCENALVNIVNSPTCFGENLIANSPEGSIINYFWEIDSFYTDSSAILSWQADTVGVFDLKLTINNPFCSKDTTVNITIYPSIPITNTNQSICQDDSVLVFNNYQSVAGTYYDSLQSINGCDSVLSITLSVNPVYLSNTNDTICQGDSILIYGNYENTAGVYYDTLQTIFGCDSVLATTLFLNANFNTSQNQEICQGDSIMLGGLYQTIGGLYYDSLQTINGCDSILSTTLTVNSLPNVTLSNFNPDTICSNSNVVTLPNGSPSGGVYSGTGVNGNTFDPNSAGLGTHSVIYTYSDINSCINSDSTFITVEQCVGIADLAKDLGILIYPNPNTGLFTIEKSSELDKEVKVSLLDATSRVIINKIIPKGQQKIEMDITSYSKGVYYLQLTVGKEVFVKQILKN
ncbi:MAG: hypothetical protein COX70_10170 [Flavobacteriales bacterium CG_4_10_14_0_2_um_filter_32_8]|nr:MAG: hypothetical protein COX70_10170 [Flavobacteriales bacterium CG_4_10_14_0_2_um_filter_32_8]